MSIFTTADASNGNTMAAKIKDLELDFAEYFPKAGSNVNIDIALMTAHYTYESVRYFSGHNISVPISKSNTDESINGQQGKSITQNHLWYNQSGININPSQTDNIIKPLR